MRHLFRFTVVCLLIAPCACDLNPQPEPPMDYAGGGGPVANGGASNLGGQAGQAGTMGNNNGGTLPEVPVDSFDQDAGASASGGDGDGDGDGDLDAGSPQQDAEVLADAGG